MCCYQKCGNKIAGACTQLQGTGFLFIKNMEHSWRKNLNQSRQPHAGAKPTSTEAGVGQGGTFPFHGGVRGVNPDAVCSAALLQGRSLGQ